MVTLFLTALSTAVVRWVVEAHFSVDGCFFRLQSERSTERIQNNCGHLSFSAEYDPSKPFSVVMSVKMPLIHFEGKCRILSNTVHSIAVDMQSNLAL